MSLPTVTQLLPPVRFFCTPAELEQYIQDGHENHAILEGAVTGADVDVSEDKAEYAMSIDRFLERHGDFLGPVLLAEERLTSKLGFTGQPDVVCANGILDLKRSVGLKKYRALQLAGYAILAREAGLVDTKHWWVFAYDAKKKEHVPVNVWNPMAEAAFMACLHRYKNDKLIETYNRSI